MIIIINKFFSEVYIEVLKFVDNPRGKQEKQIKKK